jgi:Domain of unknown function (DUF4351)
MGRVPLIGDSLPQETTVCSSKGQALQFAYGLDFLSIQAYRLWMENPSRIVECLRLALTLRLNPAKMEMIAGFVDTYLRLSDDEDEWVKDKLADLTPKETDMELLTPWHRWGMIEGRKEGRIEEALTILMRQLKRRFGPIRDEVETQVRALSLPQIEELSEAFLDFNTVDDLKQWLAEHSGDENDQPIEPTDV